MGLSSMSRAPVAKVDFIACSKDGRMREKVEMGLCMRVDASRFYFGDTRDGSVEVTTEDN